MDKQLERKLVAPLLVVFLVVSGVCSFFQKNLSFREIDPMVLGFGNTLLFILSLLVFTIQKKAIKNKNPQALVRAVMGGTFIKLMVIAIAVTIYLVAAGEKRSINAILVCMGLYIVYTIIEVRGISILNKQNGQN